MSEIWIDEAIKVIEKQIKALEDKDIDGFFKLFTPKVQENELNYEKFEEALMLFEKNPLKIEAIDKNASEIVTDSEIILRLKNSNRKLCTVVKIDNQWLVNDIYWDLKRALTEQELEQIKLKVFGQATPIKLEAPEEDEDLSDYDQFPENYNPYQNIKTEDSNIELKKEEVSTEIDIDVKNEDIIEEEIINEDIIEEKLKKEEVSTEIDIDVKNEDVIEEEIINEDIIEEEIKTEDIIDEQIIKENIIQQEIKTKAENKIETDKIGLIKKKSSKKSKKTNR